MRCEAELELQRQVTELQAEAQVRLEQTMVNAEEEKKAAIKEMTDRLNREHRMELEGLRSRFRMVHASQMERSPSDTSLEKIEVRLKNYNIFLIVANMCSKKVTSASNQGLQQVPENRFSLQVGFLEAQFFFTL